MRSASLVLAALGSLAVSALAQTTGLAGRVVQSINRAPVSFVMVRAHISLAYRDPGGSSGRDGSFKIEHVPSGEYDLVVRYSALLASPDKTRDVRRGFRLTYYPAGATRAEARSVIVKAGGAAGGLVITVRWEDRVRVQGRVTNIPAPGRPEAFRASFAFDQDKASLLDLVGASAPIHPDGSFELSGVLPGKTHLYLMTPPQGSDGYGLGVAGSTTVDVPDKGLEGALLPFYASDITVKGRVVQEKEAPAPLHTRIVFHVAELLPMPEEFDATTDANGVFQIQLMHRKYSILRAVFIYGRPDSLDHESGPERRLCRRTDCRGVPRFSDSELGVTRPQHGEDSHGGGG